MLDKRIGRRYAQALFSTALKYDMVNSVEDDLQGISNLLQNDEGFRHFLLAPYTGREEKIGLAERVFGDRVTALTMQVLRVMLEKKREAEIPVVREEFVALRRAHENVVLATVASAEPLEESQRAALIARLESVLGKKVEAIYQVDPALIGGVRVSYENYVLDGSVKGALGRLREKLRYDLLKQV